MAEEKRIWDAMLKFIGNPYGTAGLMGNLNNYETKGEQRHD